MTAHERQAYIVSWREADKLARMSTGTMRRHYIAQRDSIAFYLDATDKKVSIK